MDLRRPPLLLNSVCPGQVSRGSVSGLAVVSCMAVLSGSLAAGCLVVCSHDQPAVRSKHAVQSPAESCNGRSDPIWTLQRHTGSPMSLTLVTRWSIVVRCLFCYGSQDDRCTRDPNVWFEPFPPQGTTRPPPAANSSQQPAALLDLDQGDNMGLLPDGGGRRGTGDDLVTYPYYQLPTTR